MSRIAALNKNAVSGMDTGIDHAVAFNFEDKGIGIRYIFDREREIAADILFGKDRLTGSYLANDGNAGHLLTYHLKAVINDLDRSGFGRIPADQSVSFQSRKMRVHGRGGFQIDSFADIPYRRRIPFLDRLFFNIVQYFLLLCR